MTFLETEEQQKKIPNKHEESCEKSEMGPSGGEGRKEMCVFNLCLQCLCGTCPWHNMVKQQFETLPLERNLHVILEMQGKV